jgi:hypothetical protein
MVNNENPRDREYDQPYNGIQFLKGSGIPDSAITALLVLLTTITLVPYVAGWEFGPYAIPELIPPSIFWILVGFTPLIWIILLGKFFGINGIRWKALVIRYLLIEIIVLLPAFASSPMLENKTFEGNLEKCETFKENLIFHTSGRLEVTLIKVEPNEELLVTICGASEENCRGIQHGQDVPYVRSLPKGEVRILVFNFCENSPVKFKLAVKYIRRRFL